MTQAPRQETAVTFSVRNTTGATITVTVEPTLESYSVQPGQHFSLPGEVWDGHIHIDLCEGGDLSLYIMEPAGGDFQACLDGEPVEFN